MVTVNDKAHWNMAVHHGETPGTFLQGTSRTADSIGAQGGLGITYPFSDAFAISGGVALDVKKGQSATQGESAYDPRNKFGGSDSTPLAPDGLNASLSAFLRFSYTPNL